METNKHFRVRFIALILDCISVFTVFQYKMRWFPSSVFISDFFSPSFHLLFLFKPSELLQGWLYPPWPKEDFTGETTSSCWFCCTDSCTAVSHKVFESPALRAFGPWVAGPSHLLSLQRRAVKSSSFAWTHQHSLSFLKREPNSLARNNGRRWIQMG